MAGCGLLPPALEFILEKVLFSPVPMCSPLWQEGTEREGGWEQALLLTRGASEGTIRPWPRKPLCPVQKDKDKRWVGCPARPTRFPALPAPTLDWPWVIDVTRTRIPFSAALGLPGDFVQEGSDQARGDGYGGSAAWGVSPAPSFTLWGWMRKLRLGEVEGLSQVTWQ